MNFGRKLKKEYESNTINSFFLCTIALFKNQWEFNASKIKDLGEEFLKENISDIFEINPNCSFFSTLFRMEDEARFKSILDTVKKQIRIDFINWNIERLKK